MSYVYAAVFALPFVILVALLLAISLVKANGEDDE